MSSSLNHLKINLVSFRTFRCPLFPKPVAWFGLFWPLLTARQLYTHSRFGHYFCSNLYGSAPRGPRGVKRCAWIHLTCHLRFGALILPQKGTNFEKPSKLEKNVKKHLFFQTFSNIVQFGGIISAPNLKWHVKWILAHLLTPLGPLGADPYRQYQGFSICF